MSRATRCRAGASVSPGRARDGPWRAVLPGLAGLARALPWLMAMSPAAVEPIVLVDDDAEMRAMLRDFLAGAGFRVVEAGDTEALLDLVPRVSPAAIILDHELPGDWGLEVLPLLRQRHPEVPVILITAFGGPRLQATAERLGAAGYLDKPFRMARLLSLLEHVRAPA